MSATHPHSQGPLAPLVDGIAAELRAQADQEVARAGLVAAMRALIFATLARLVGRLGAMVHLWQSGQVPPTPSVSRRTSLPGEAPSASGPLHLPSAASGPWSWLASWFASRDADLLAPAPRARTASHAPRPARAAGRHAPRPRAPARIAPAASPTAPPRRHAPASRPPSPPCAASPGTPTLGPSRPGFSRPAPDAAPTLA